MQTIVASSTSLSTRKRQQSGQRQITKQASFSLIYPLKQKRRISPHLFPRFAKATDLLKSRLPTLNILSINPTAEFHPFSAAEKK
jgi:hypothetical protein